MLHACAARFNVTGNLESFLVLGELNKPMVEKKVITIHEEDQATFMSFQGRGADME